MVLPSMDAFPAGPSQLLMWVSKVEGSLSFLWLYDSSTERILPSSERTLVSLDGTLYFSYVVKEDETSYACSLSLSSTQSGHYGPFFRLNVPVSQDVPFAPRIDAAQPQIFPEAPTIGTTVYLECFAYGNPTPIYKWTRVDGRRVSKKAVLMHHGRVLRFDNAELADAGRYKCSAANSMGVAAREVVLSLRTPPTIVIPLSDKLVGSNSDFTLECPPSSMDTHSTVEWFKDAKPIVPLLMPNDQRKRFHVDQSRLFVNSTISSDSGVYQCVMSNEVGTTSSSAYVQVRDSAPVFPRQSMPRKMFAVVGSSVSVPCFYYASPRGHSRWSDAGGAKLPHKGRVRDHHGVLIIENVLNDDAGYFFCTAHNRHGKAHYQVELVVMGKAHMRVDSADTAADTSADAMNISCSVELDCGNAVDCPEAYFRWTFDNKSLHSVPGLHFKTKFREHTRHSKHGRHLVQEVGLQISSPGKAVTPRKVACYSLYGEESVDVMPRPLTAPLALKVEQSNETVRLSWKKPSAHRDIRNHAISGEAETGGYLVELRTKRDRHWRPAPREVVAESESQSVTLAELAPNSLYQFRVRTVDASVIGDPSSPTAWVRTPPAPPSEAVQSLKWKTLDNATILVEWDPVETDHQSGGDLRYRLSWSLDNEKPSESASQERKFFAHHIDTPTPQAVVRLNATEQCRMLVFSVRPMNNQGAGLVSTDTVAFVNSKGEPRHVFFNNVTVLNSTHATFSWEWEKSNECGRAPAVQLSCTASLSETDPITVAISSEFSEWTLGDLTANTKYECVVRPLNGEEDVGPSSSPLEITTMQQPPTEAPSINKLSLKPTEDQIGYTTVIEWSAIQFPQVNVTDQANGYKIFVYVSETASEAVVLTMPVSQLSNPDRPSARLDGLRLMYMYTIRVAGFNSGGVGPLSAPRTIRLGPQSSIDDSYTSKREKSLLLADMNNSELTERLEKLNAVLQELKEEKIRHLKESVKAWEEKYSQRLSDLEFSILRFQDRCKLQSSEINDQISRVEDMSETNTTIRQRIEKKLFVHGPIIQSENPHTLLTLTLSLIRGILYYTAQIRDLIFRAPAPRKTDELRPTPSEEDLHKHSMGWGSSESLSKESTSTEPSSSTDSIGNLGEDSLRIRRFKEPQKN
ncbi:hypothetical protein Q1695_005770 [Nippostrongylus brasiliensis]|nr:hypothetical protein Q1695_005770 [Nippostrongylus brasiliensis]